MVAQVAHNHQITGIVSRPCNQFSGLWRRWSSRFPVTEQTAGSTPVNPAIFGPFDYRLGHQILNLKKAARHRYGLPCGTIC